MVAENMSTRASGLARPKIASMSSMKPMLSISSASSSMKYSIF